MTLGPENPRSALRLAAGNAWRACAQGGSGISVAASTAAEGSSPADGAARSSAACHQLQTRPWCGRYALPSREFSAETVGAKSRNTVSIQVRALCPAK